ncbi:hypothetical protein [Corynebacterium sp. HS2168-gen11]|uniref:hypothetical protein n=1 Tax=Corynebacterium sp. HS2168-gen11 TaxID=2974027 RepID=UPI00216B0B31|nr:hypothetical protein [Corynebacterium sp. HS2168-gen11]MCS4535383.1 hypothetical protein [Corynebacterium sp. HS2168-gen11]
MKRLLIDADSIRQVLANLDTVCSDVEQLISTTQQEHLSYGFSSLAAIDDLAEQHRQLLSGSHSSAQHALNLILAHIQWLQGALAASVQALTGQNDFNGYIVERAADERTVMNQTVQFPTKPATDVSSSAVSATSAPQAGSLDELCDSLQATQISDALMTAEVWNSVGSELATTATHVRASADDLLRSNEGIVFEKAATSFQAVAAALLNSSVTFREIGTVVAELAGIVEDATAEATQAYQEIEELRAAGTEFELLMATEQMLLSQVLGSLSGSLSRAECGSYTLFSLTTQASAGSITIGGNHVGPALNAGSNQAAIHPSAALTRTIGTFERTHVGFAHAPSLAAESEGLADASQLHDAYSSHLDSHQNLASSALNHQPSWNMPTMSAHALPTVQPTVQPTIQPIAQAFGALPSTLSQIGSVTHSGHTPGSLVPPALLSDKLHLRQHVQPTQISALEHSKLRGIQGLQSGTTGVSTHTTPNQLEALGIAQPRNTAALSATDKIQQHPSNSIKHAIGKHIPGTHLAPKQVELPSDSRAHRAGSSSAHSMPHTESRGTRVATHPLAAPQSSSQEQALRRPGAPVAAHGFGARAATKEKTKRQSSTITSLLERENNIEQLIGPMQQFVPRVIGGENR